MRFAGVFGDSFFCARRDAVDRSNAAATTRGKRHARKEVIRIEVLCFTIP
jgi:hypothetical protein